MTQTCLDENYTNMKAKSTTKIPKKSKNSNGRVKVIVIRCKFLNR